MKFTCRMEGVREYAEQYAVELYLTEEGDHSTPAERWVVRAYNEAHHNCTEIDILDLVSWLRTFAPSLLTDRPLSSPLTTESHQS